MWIEPVVLEGRHVRLRPLLLGDAGALSRFHDPALFAYYLDWPEDGGLEAYRAYLSRALSDSFRLVFAIEKRASRVVVGHTAFLEMRQAHKALEIGFTLIAKPHQGTPANPESKYLMLRHAFEEKGAVRVQLKTDERNLQSQRAIEKLGALREGVLRKYQTRKDGYVRNTVIYSILESEWPRVKRGLEARLAHK